MTDIDKAAKGFMLAIDEYGELCRKLKPMLKLQDMLKAKLKALGNGEHEGVDYTVYVTPKDWEGFDTETFKAEHFDLFCKYRRTKPYQEVTVQRK